MSKRRKPTGNLLDEITGAAKERHQDQTKPKKKSENKPGTVPGKSRVTMYLTDEIMFALDQYHLDQKREAKARGESVPSKSEIVDNAIVEYLRTRASHLIDDM